MPRDPSAHLLSRTVPTDPHPQLQTPCLIWTGATRNGRPRATVHGREVSVRRYLWLQGRPSENHGYLKSRCGIRLCISPDHAREA